MLMNSKGSLQFVTIVARKIMCYLQELPEGVKKICGLMGKDDNMLNLLLFYIFYMCPNACRNM